MPSKKMKKKKNYLPPSLSFFSFDSLSSSPPFSSPKTCSVLVPRTPPPIWISIRHLLISNHITNLREACTEQAKKFCSVLTNIAKVSLVATEGFRSFSSTKLKKTSFCGNVHRRLAGSKWCFLSNAKALSALLVDGLSIIFNR